MKNTYGYLSVLLIVTASLVVILLSSDGSVHAQSLPPLDSNCSDGECVFGVSAINDDASPNQVCAFGFNWPEVYLGRCGSTSIVSGLRFAGVALPANAGISQAYIVFTVDGPFTAPVTVAIYGEDSSNSQPFHGLSQPISRTRISGVSTVWSIPSSDIWSVGQVRQSPDVTAIVQAIVDRPGWQSGNALSVLSEPTSATASGAFRRVFAFDRAGISSSARLVIRTGPRRIFLPAVAKYSPPPLSSPSYYVQDVNTIKDKGTVLGNHARNTLGTQDYLVILVYGYLGRNNSTGEYGAYYTFNPTVFIGQTDIINSASDVARNFYSARGSDTSSKLRLVIGVNNCCSGVSLSIFQNHGTAWGSIINSIKSNIDACCSSQVSVAAGLDAEQAWAGVGVPPYRSTQWLDRYMGSSNCDPATGGDDGCMYNYGTSHPDFSVNGDICATSDTQVTWPSCDIWYMSWGAIKNGKRFPRALPEIYHIASSQPPYGTDATAWKNLSVFSIERKTAGPIWFVGSLTQFARCGPICDDGYGPYGNNTPEQGWGLLMDALGSDSRTAQVVHWSTDIRFQTAPWP